MAVLDASATTDEVARFEELQARLRPLWASFARMTDDEQTIVVVPSMPPDDEKDGAVQQAYEERFLFLLLLLRQPSARLVYVTSQPIQPEVVDYYLGLMPGVIASHARPRLHLVSPQDASPSSLTGKLLARPRLLERIRRLIPDPERAHLVPYATTDLERRLAVELGIPMYGADPKFFHHGTKTGCRRLFAEEGVRHPAGVEDLWTADDVVAAVAKVRGAHPEVEQVLVKLNEGVSGQGNAVVDLRAVPAPGEPGADAALEAAVRSLAPEAPGLSAEAFLALLPAIGGVVEERITGEELRSPSVQLRVTPLGDLEVLSTHDQLLGGPSGQSYLGCAFPADPAYAAQITAEAEKVGRRLAAEGVLGRFALDFVVTRRPDGTWAAFAIEVNLRKGGTTHPFLTLQFLTDGAYDPAAATFRTPSGEERCFVASDHVEGEQLRGLTPDDLFDVAVRHRLHYDHGRQVGVVFHMMSALASCGRVGLTAVARTPEEAEELYRRALAAIEGEAAPAYRHV